LMYDHRTMLIDCLRSRGYNVYYNIGEVYDDYRRRYAKAKIALSWSSLLDTPVRVFEAFGMGIPLVANRTPDIVELFDEGTHFLGFDNVTEGTEQVEYALNNYEYALEMARNALWLVEDRHTWDHRVERILLEYE